MHRTFTLRVGPKIHIAIFMSIFQGVKISIFYRDVKSELAMGRFVFFVENCLMDFFVFIMDGVNDLGGY